MHGKKQQLCVTQTRQCTHQANTEGDIFTRDMSLFHKLRLTACADVAGFLFG